MLSLEALLLRYRPMAHAIARSLCDGAADPEDLVQDAALALHAALQEGDGRFESAAHARNYFLRTVKNLAIKSGARPRPASLPADPAGREDPEAAFQRERIEALRRVLDELPRGERDLLRRRFQLRETLQRISASTGTPVSTLHSRERAILERIRRRMDRSQGGPQAGPQAGPGGAS